MEKTSQPPQGQTASEVFQHRRAQPGVDTEFLSGLAAAINQSPVVQAQMRLAEEINQRLYTGAEHGTNAAGPAPAELTAPPHSGTNDLMHHSKALSTSSAPVQRQATVQRAKYGDKLAAQFGADGPPSGDYPPEHYTVKNGHFLGREFNISATFNPDRVKPDQDADESGGEIYRTVEYRQYARGEFKSNGQVVEKTLYKGQKLDKTTFNEDGYTNSRYGHRNEPDNHGKYKDEDESGSSYTAVDYPSLNVDKGETVSINLDFQGKLVVTDEKSRETGPVLAVRSWSMKGQCTRSKNNVITVGPIAEKPKAQKQQSGKHGKAQEPRKQPSKNQKGKKKATTAAIELAESPGDAAGEPEIVGFDDASTAEPTALKPNEHESGRAGQPFRPAVAQFAKAAEITGISGDDNREKALVAGYLSHVLKQDPNSEDGPDTILSTGLDKDYLAGDNWKEVDIPNGLAATIAILPTYYVPTTAKIWKEFIDRIDTHSGKLAPPKESEVSKAEHEPNDEVEKERAKILEHVAKTVAPVKKTLSEKEQRLFDSIMNAQITVNFSIDKLFQYRSPQLLNAFEVREKYKIQSNNVQGSLEDQRRQAEERHFGIPDTSQVSRIRPRYAALNFKGHPGGATPRNDYGLSYMVLSRNVASSSTITVGDSFDAENAYPYTPEGVKNLVIKVFGREKYLYTNLVAETQYDPGDLYLEVQVHKDLDIRKDADRIMVSKVEMKAFQLDVGTVKALIDTLAGKGVFVLG